MDLYIWILMLVLLYKLLGNIFIRKCPTDPEKHQMVLIDHGMYATLSENIRLTLCQLFKSLLINDNDGITNAIDNLHLDKFKDILTFMITFRPSGGNTQYYFLYLVLEVN